VLPRSITGVTDTDVSCAVPGLCLQLPPSSSHATGSVARSHAAAAALQSLSQQLTRQGAHSAPSSALHVATRDLQAELSSAAHERNVRRRAQLVQDAAAAVAAAATAPASAATLNSSPAAAVAAPRRPALPQLTSEDKQELAQGLRVQRQTRQGGAGSGFVVVDVKAEPATVIEILKSYRAYTVSIEHSLTQLAVR
jgi:hypothetical protein